jgi:hypothetical protein
MLSIRTTLEVSNVEMSPLNETAFCNAEEDEGIITTWRVGERGAS